MRTLSICLMILTPCAAFAAAGGVGEGFGAEDWLRKWPVLLIVVGAVAATTTFFARKIFRRAKTSGSET